MVIGVTHPPFGNTESIELYDAQRLIARQLVRTIDHILADRTRSGSPFSRVDPARIGIVGHSVGGGAAAQACAWEPRIRAGVDLDGTVFGDVVHTGMQQPFFLLQRRVNASRRDPPRFLEYHDRATLHEDSVFAHSATVYWLAVDRLDHMSFTDRALSPTMFQRLETATGFRLSATRTQDMTSQYVLAFFDHYLGGVPLPAIFRSPPFPGTSIRIKP
jgi:dienelactone hydrolase